LENIVLDPDNNWGKFAILVGDATKLREATGWEPKYELRQSLTDILNYWRDKYTIDK